MVTPERQTKLDHRQANLLPGVLVVLEDVVDPHNAAAILRTCDGLGVGTAWYLFDTVKPYDPKRTGLRSSATANKWVETEVFTSRAELKARLQAAGCQSIGTTLHEEGAELLWQADFTGNEKVALWVGNEHTGLSPAAKGYCDRLLTIPMRGMVESFNVSVATALVLAELARQRRLPSGE